VLPYNRGNGTAIHPRLCCSFAPRGEDRAFAKRLYLITKTFEKCFERSGLMRQKGGQAQPRPTNAEQINDGRQSLNIVSGATCPFSMPAAAGRTSRKDDAVGAHFKWLEKQRPADSPGTGHPHHMYLGGAVKTAVLKLLPGGVRPPVAEE
jgi:hypothetical protein